MPEGAERRDLALKRLAAGESIPQMEARLTVPGDVGKLVFVTGRPVEADDACMLFTFVDLEHRRMAQSAPKASKERTMSTLQPRSRGR